MQYSKSEYKEIVNGVQVVVWINNSYLTRTEV